MKVATEQANSETQNEPLACFNLNGKDCVITEKQEPDGNSRYRQEYSCLGEFELDDTVYQIRTKKHLNSEHLSEAVETIDLNLAFCLTERELQIAVLVAKGLLNKQIADKLSLSVYTVSTHLRRIFTKFGVHNRTALAAKIKGQ
ncbi:response regulator transcription factor [Methylomonas sp. MgM2]